MRKLTQIGLLLITVGVTPGSQGCNRNDNFKKNTSSLESLTEKNYSAYESQQDKTIETIVTTNYTIPVTSVNSSPITAANLIVAEFNKWAAIKCSQTINASLANKWKETKDKFIGKVPPSSVVEFLVLVDKFNCNVIGMVQKTQTIRVRDDVCSVNDIKLESPDLLFDPSSTGFFSIKIQF